MNTLLLSPNYGCEETTPSYTGPLMYKSYCRALLKRDFWGDEVVLYAISCMWNLHIKSSIPAPTKNIE